MFERAKASRALAGADAPVPRPTDRISDQARHHIELRRKVIAARPDALALAGTDPGGTLAALALLALHWTTVWAVSHTNLLVVFLTAFFFGQLVLHAAGALIHETAHGLVFRDRPRKLAFDLVLEAITTSFGRQLTYQHEHITSHHPFLGNYERDYEHEDICRFLARRSYRARHRRAQRLLTAAELIVHLVPLGFLLADEIFPRLYGRLTGSASRDAHRDIGASRAPAWERRLFIAVSFAVNILLFACFGFLGWLYHIWSLSLFLGKCGVTNLGQSLSEHPGDDAAAPTRSTYWWGNAILFNSGFHHEHHTFPDVAWSRLPRLKAMAPDAFDRPGERSYVRCWWDHVRADFDLPSRRNPLQASDHPERCRARAQRGVRTTLRAGRPQTR
jgi:sphingolipid 4-desaturase/C4-monooxygenase